MFERIKIDIADGIAEVCLNRPEKKNALDPLFFEELIAAGESLHGRNDLRAVVMYGAGGCFCAGLDTSSLGGMASDLDATRDILRNPPAGDRGNKFQRPTLAWQEIEAPVIAAVEGVAFGGGIQIALAADFRFAAPDARLSIMEARWGIIPDMGITQYLPQLMPADRAKDLIMTGRIVDADEALSLGLVTRVCDDPLAQARAYAKMLSLKNPEAVRANKQMINAVWGAGDDALRMEADLQADIIGSANQMEAVMSEMQKRAPVWK
ncbi:MAG: crotonase/enoyl-CoA hydratase family protein [Pseudomonadota bacterium]